MSCGTCAKLTTQAAANAANMVVSGGAAFGVTKCPSCGWFLPTHGSCKNTNCSGTALLSLGDYADQIRQQRGRKKIPAGIRKRWNERVVAQGMDGQPDGAQQYLSRYGRNIGAAKVWDLARQAEAEGCPVMANGFWEKAYQIDMGQNPPTSPTSGPGRPPTSAHQPTPAPPSDQISITGLPAHLQPGKIGTMQPVESKLDRQEFIDDPEYWGQPKRNGERRIIVVGGTEAPVGQSRALNERVVPTAMMRNALTYVAQQRGAFVLDGEEWWRAADGKECRNAAQAAEYNKKIGQPTVRPVPMFTAFQCLYAEGKDLTGEPAGARIAEAERIVDDLTMTNATNFEMIPTARSKKDKTTLARKQKKEGREGEVWIRTSAPYVPGKKGGQNAPLVKTKYRIDRSLVITGFTESSVAGRPFGAIQVSARNSKGKLVSVGKIGTGFTQKEMQELWDAHHANPGKVVIDISAEEITTKGKVSQGAYTGRIRTDMKPADCVLEELE